jgi:hypothetical protein
MAQRRTTREAAVRLLARASFRRADLLRQVAGTLDGETAVLIEERPQALDPPSGM